MTTRVVCNVIDNAFHIDNAHFESDERSFDRVILCTESYTHTEGSFHKFHMN